MVIIWLCERTEGYNGSGWWCVVVHMVYRPGSVLLVYQACTISMGASLPFIWLLISWRCCLFEGFPSLFLTALPLQKVLCYGVTPSYQWCNTFSALSYKVYSYLCAISPDIGLGSYFIASTICKSTHVLISVWSMIIFGATCFGHIMIYYIENMTYDEYICTCILRKSMLNQDLCADSWAEKAIFSFERNILSQREILGSQSNMGGGGIVCI